LTESPWLIVIAASAGGIPAIKTVLAGLPPTIPASVVIVQHRPPHPGSRLEQILARSARVSVKTAKADEPIQPGVAYIAQPNRHLTVGPSRRFTYTDGTRIRGVLSSANPLLESAAEAFGDRTIAVVLSGSGMDGTDGVQTVKSRGGIVIAQDPASADFDRMPQAAVGTGIVDHVLPLGAIAAALVAITSGGSLDDVKRIESTHERNQRDVRG